ncbi:hypothetical protein RHSIM_Rhsim13G0056300 [Rhododendron simsii]|uniref:Exonuclease domain-containing protein n=1 Tax=Rhododendron simsii TaxID=118357 RepID=A0A834FZ04_RHOSS|nr:hypothetical protein RHSIM_Rhsim13G0056300 [Rhododendron simsii]
MNQFANAFSLLEVDVADDREQTDSVVPTVHQENANERDELNSTRDRFQGPNLTFELLLTLNFDRHCARGEEKGDSSGETILTKSDSGCQQPLEMVSGVYKLPLVWIDLEMTGMYCFNSVNWHSVPWLGQEKRILVRNIWLYKICDIKHVSEVNGSILPGIALICKKRIALLRKEKQTKHSSLDPLRCIIQDPLMRYVLQHFPVLLSWDPDAGQNVCATVGFPVPWKMSAKSYVSLNKTLLIGLNVEVDRILEIACVVTDGNLSKSIEADVLKGLTEKVLQSTTGEQEAEKQVIEFVKRYVGTYTPLLAGNSVYTDFLFLKKYMPDLASLFSHVIVDVSSVRALCVRWYPKVWLRFVFNCLDLMLENKKAPAKENKHRAMDDIWESIAELKYLKENIFKPSKQKK